MPNHAEQATKMLPGDKKMQAVTTKSSNGQGGILRAFRKSKVPANGGSLTVTADNTVLHIPGFNEG